jgi:hypothetical protein
MQSRGLPHHTSAGFSRWGLNGISVHAKAACILAQVAWRSHIQLSMGMTQPYQLNVAVRIDGRFSQGLERSHRAAIAAAAFLGRQVVRWLAR